MLLINLIICILSIKDLLTYIDFIMDDKYHIVISVYNGQPIDIIANNEYSKTRTIDAFNESDIKIISISCVKI